MNGRAVTPLLAAIFSMAVLLMASPVSAQPQPDDLVPTPENVVIDQKRRNYSEMEIKLLQELEVRRVDLERREQALAVRERLVDLAESRLSARVGKLEELKTKLETLLKNLSDKEEDELEQLTKIYENMRPAAAATVVNRLDNRIVFDVFRRMRDKNTAKIMEKMNPEKARQISELLAEKKDLPTFGDQ